jgi:hypothetical protein
MNRKLVLFAVLGVVAVTAGFIATLSIRRGGQETASAAPDGISGTFLSYSVKFVCGYQDLVTSANLEPPVKPGNYATDINIHNPNYVGSAAGQTSVQVWKKLVILVGTRDNQPFAFREPQLAKPTRFLTFRMPPDTATMDDCQAIWRMAEAVGTPVTPGALTIGYVVIMSQRPLDVDAVYTAAVPGKPGTTATGITEDVERVSPTRVRVPEGVLR